MNPEEQTPLEQQPIQPTTDSPPAAQTNQSAEQQSAPSPANPPVQGAPQNFSQAPIGQQPVQQQPFQPQPAVQAQNNKTDAWGITSIVLVFFAVPVGLVVGIIGLYKAKKNHYSNTLSLIGTILNGVLMVIVVPILLMLFATTLFGVQSKGQDVERETDIKAINAQLEASFAQTGTYPTLSQLNDASWRAVNMKGLDNEALRDPSADAGNFIIVSSPTKNAYSYQVYEVDGKTVCTVVNACATHVLTATLNNETSGQNGLFIKKSLN